MSEKPKKDLVLLVHGASGRMGKAVIECAQTNANISVITGVSRFNKLSAGGDVVIDFSLPVALDELLKFCVIQRIPLVSGTTGYSLEQKKQMEQASESIPILWSANMSFGVHLFVKMMKEFRHVSEWNFGITETHHIHKKDAPSGTALWLKQELDGAVGKTTPAPKSIREGEIVGEHEVLGVGPMEEIQLIHRATDRRVFANGSIKAAEWLVNQKPGLYSLGDLFHNNP